MLRFLLMGLMLLATIATTSASDGDRTIRVANVSLEPSIVDDEWLLSADFDIPANEQLDVVLRAGVTLSFVAEFELIRPRWYWRDERLVEKRQSYRLSYHLLTGRYRLDTEGFIQQFVALEDVLRALSQLRGWAVVRSRLLEPGGEYFARVRLRLASEQLPRPYQISAINDDAWDIEGEWKRFRMNSPTPINEQ